MLVLATRGSGTASILVLAAGGGRLATASRGPATAGILAATTGRSMGVGMASTAGVGGGVHFVVWKMEFVAF
jgi:hypothetical protein